jgi:serine-type D-Ala-D-Ala carboxypeptidase/endopeptidase
MPSTAPLPARQPAAAFVRSSRLCALAAVAVMASAPPAAAAPLTAAGLQQRLDQRVQGDRTGLCVQAAVVQGPRVLRASACAGTRSSPPPAADAAFEIGSVSKTMLGALVAGLVADGRWSLDDPIARHLPPGTAVPSQGARQILVRDLLTHTAGLPALPPGMAPANPLNPYADLTEAVLLQALGRTTLSGTLGQTAAYSNFGAMLLSLAVARAGVAADPSADLEALLARQLFGPLGMAGAYIARPPAGSRAATGHGQAGQPVPAWTWAAAPSAAGVGGVRAPLDDMVRYAQAQLSLLDSLKGTPLAAQLRETQQPLAGAFAMGWVVAPVQGRSLVLHEGGTGGFSSLVLLEPATQQAVVVLADTALADLGGLGRLGLALLDDSLPAAPARRAVPLSDAQLRDLPGTYSLGPMTLRLRAENGRLMAQADGQSAFELRADSAGDLYPAAGFSALLTPERPRPAAPGTADTGTPSTAVERFVWRQGGGAMEGRRQRTAP